VAAVLDHGLKLDIQSCPPWRRAGNPVYSYTHIKLMVWSSHWAELGWPFVVQLCRSKRNTGRIHTRTSPLRKTLTVVLYRTVDGMLSSICVFM
jgi:hypothetical protein